MSSIPGEQSSSDRCRCNVAELSQEGRAAGFVRLFNDKNLDGWQGARETYVVGMGLLLCKAHGNKGITDAASGQLKALIVDGRMNRSHDWKTTSALLKKHLEQTGLFTVNFATAPPKGESLSNFKPDFAAYDVVVFNYEEGEWTEAEQWPIATRTAFVDYAKSGGGVVIHHTSSGAFPAWKEYSEIEGLGGWHGRTEKDGPYIYWLGGKIVRDNTAGPGGGHGPRHGFPLVVRKADHPITQGLPMTFM